MWLPEKPYFPIDDHSTESDEMSAKPRASSPPLEGGESLCEFYGDCKGDSFLQDRNDPNGDSIQEVIQDVVTNEQYNQSPSEDEKFANKPLFTFIGRGLLPPNSTFTQSFLQSILSSIDSRDPLIAHAWMETLFDVIDVLPKEVIKGQILPLVVKKGQLSQPNSSRVISCKMLGKLCTIFEPYIIKKEVLPVILSLCQDTNHEVRGRICRQLDHVAKGIGLETTKNAILPVLVELANDEEGCVRVAGIETVVQMLPLLDDETCTQTIIPLVQKFCENAMNAEDSTLLTVSKHLGRLCHGLAINFSTEQKLWFLQFFQNLADLGLPEAENSALNAFSPMPDIVPQLDNINRHRECRCFCAYNVPGMSLFTGLECFKDEFHPTFSKLCKDPCLNVRRTVASGFYEVVKFLNAQSAILLGELICLLKDNSLEVLKGVIPTLPETLKIICHSVNSSIEYQDDFPVALIEALKTCEETTSLSTNWRLYAEFLTQISCLPQCLSPDVIYTNFVPLLFVKLHTARPIPCRIAAAHSLLVLLRNTQKLEQRNGIINELIRDLCNGKSCHKRMLFIKVCEIVLDLFSKAFFKKHFFKPVLQLSEDHIPNIRLRLCTILPKLKNLMKLPKDSGLLQDLEASVRNLMTDEKDVDVIEAVNKAIEELDKIEVPTEPTSRRTSCIDIEADLEDIRKETEERKLLEMEFTIHDENEKKHLKTNSETRSLTRQGKIPVRKSGTLPKPSKSKEFKSNTLTKGTSLSSPAKRSVKRIERSSPTPSFVNMKKSSTMDKIASYTHYNSRPSVISPTKPIVRSKSSQVSNIPKMPVDRSPSPMPVVRRFSDHCASGDTAVMLLNNSQDHLTKYSEKVTSIPTVISFQANTIKGSCRGSVSAKTQENTLEDRTKCRTPLPSPEVSRKSASSPSLGSRIPTPNVGSK